MCVCVGCGYQESVARMSLRSSRWLSQLKRQRMPTSAALTAEARLLSTATSSGLASGVPASTAASAGARGVHSVVGSVLPAPRGALMRAAVGVTSQPLSRKSIVRVMACLGDSQTQRLLFSTYSKKATLSRAEAEANYAPSDASKQGVFALHLNDARMYNEVRRRGRVGKVTVSFGGAVGFSTADGVPYERGERWLTT